MVPGFTVDFAVLCHAALVHPVMLLSNRAPKETLACLAGHGTKVVACRSFSADNTVLTCGRWNVVAIFGCIAIAGLIRAAIIRHGTGYSAQTERSWWTV